MKRYLLILILGYAGICSAQIVKPDSTSNWKKKLVTQLNFNQASFSSNWKAGAVNFIGLNSLFNYAADYSKDRINWDNEVDLLYGFVNNQGQGYRKSVDRIFLDTKFGYALSDNWDVFTSLNFLSQFSKGYKYDDTNDTKQLVSDFLAPGFITSAWGFEYHPTDYFNLRISPIAPRVTIVKDSERFVTTDVPEPYGVEPPRDFRWEPFAFQVQAEFDKDVATNVNLKARYLLYANYETFAFKTIDHRLDVTLTTHISKFLTAGFGSILLYDYDQDSHIQLSQVFNVGFAYSFQNFVEEEEE